jgi:hypothetical protein
MVTEVFTVYKKDLFLLKIINKLIITVQNPYREILAERTATIQLTMKL